MNTTTIMGFRLSSFPNHRGNFANSHTLAGWCAKCGEQIISCAVTATTAHDKTRWIPYAADAQKRHDCKKG
jgi:hypothetical protein